MSIGHPLTEEQVEFIRRNFANMRNQDLADAVGVSKSAVCNVQARYGLRKSKEHNSAMGAKAGRASNVARGGVAINITPEVIRKRVESYRKTYREERARWTFGLPLRTKIHVRLQPRRKCSQRSYLKKLGYILDEANNIAYYTESTTRAVRMERNWDGKRNYYKFVPYPAPHESQEINNPYQQ